MCYEDSLSVSLSMNTIAQQNMYMGGPWLQYLTEKQLMCTLKKIFTIVHFVLAD